MITSIDPRLMMIIGLLLMLLGFALPVFMIMQILKSSFFLNFLSYTASFLGLMMGIVGVATLVIRHRHD